MTPLAGALLAAGAVAAFGLAMVGLVLGWRRDQRRYIGRDRHFERRLRRVAAPLADPAAARAQAAGTESIFRKREERARLAFAWRPLERLYPLVDPPRALAVAMGAGCATVAFAGFALWFLKVPAGWWTLPALCAAGGFGGWQAMRWQQARQEAAFIRQFPEIVDQIVRLAGAGVPSVEALTVVAGDAPEPVRPVLTEVCDALTAGLDTDRFIVEWRLDEAAPADVHEAGDAESGPASSESPSGTSPVSAGIGPAAVVDLTAEMAAMAEMLSFG